MFSPSAKWEETLKLIIPLNNKFSICMYHGVSISMLNITLSHITSHSSPCLLIPAALLPHSSWNYRTCEGSSKLVSGPGGTDSGAAASCPPAPTLHPSPSGSTAPTSSPWATTTPTSKVKHYCDLNQCVRNRVPSFPQTPPPLSGRGASPSSSAAEPWCGPLLLQRSDRRFGRSRSRRGRIEEGGGGSSAATTSRAKR